MKQNLEKILFNLNFSNFLCLSFHERPTVSLTSVHLFSILCCTFVLFVFILCLVPNVTRASSPMLPVPWVFPFLIAPSVISNIYFNNIFTFCRFGYIKLV